MVGVRISSKKPEAGADKPMHRIKQVAAIVLAVLAVVIIFLNKDPVKVQLIFDTVDLPLWVLLFLIWVVGFLVGVLFMLIVARKKKAAAR
jgi:putative membrane protein